MAERIPTQKEVRVAEFRRTAQTAKELVRLSLWEIDAALKRQEEFRAALEATGYPPEQVTLRLRSGLPEQHLDTSDSLERPVDPVLE